MKTMILLTHVLSSIALAAEADPPELNPDGSFFLWFLCALGFLKVSQHMDTILSSLGLHVTKTGGSMLEEVVMAGKAVTGLFKSLGGAFGAAGIGHGLGGKDGGGGDHNPPAGADLGITGIPAGPSGPGGPGVPTGPAGSGRSSGTNGIPSAPVYKTGGNSNPVPNLVPKHFPGTQTAPNPVGNKTAGAAAQGDIPQNTTKPTVSQPDPMQAAYAGLGITVVPTGVGPAKPAGETAKPPQTGDLPVWDGPGYPEEIGTWTPLPPLEWDGPGYPDDIGGPESIPVNPDAADGDAADMVPAGAVDAANAETVPVGEDQIDQTVPDPLESEPIPMSPDTAPEASDNIPPVSEVDMLSGLGISMGEAPHETTTQTIPAAPVHTGPVPGSSTPVSGETHSAASGTGTVTEVNGAVPQHSVAGAPQTTVPKTPGMSHSAAPQTDSITPMDGTSVVENSSPLGSTPQPGSIPLAPETIEVGAAGATGTSSANGVAAVLQDGGEAAAPEPLPEGNTDHAAAKPEVAAGSVPSAPAGTTQSQAFESGLADLGITATPVSPPKRPPHSPGYYYKPGVSKPGYDAEEAQRKRAEAEAAAAQNAGGSGGSVPSSPVSSGVSSSASSHTPVETIHTGAGGTTVHAVPASSKGNPSDPRPAGYTPPSYGGSGAPVQVSGESAEYPVGGGAVGSSGTTVQSGVPASPSSSTGYLASPAVVETTAPEDIPGVSIQSPVSAVPAGNGTATVPTSPTVSSPSAGADLVPTAAEQPTPMQTAPVQSVPQQSVPVQPASSQTVSYQTAPGETVPGDHSGVQEPAAQQTLISASPETQTMAGQTVPQSPPVFQSLERGDGFVTGVETLPGGRSRRFALYSTARYETPEGPFELVKTPDGTSWYRQVEEPEENSLLLSGGKKTLGLRLPKPPRRKPKP